MINSIMSSNAQSVIQNKNGKSDEQVRLLRHQQEAIQEQINNIKNGDADPKTKRELIAPLQEEIQNIDAQIQQKQVEQTSDKDDSSEAKVKKESPLDGTTGESEKLSRDVLFFDMSSTYKQIRNVNSAGKNLMGKSRVLSSEAHLDAQRGNTRSAERKNAEAASLRVKAYSLESKIGKLNSDIDDTVKNITDKTKEDNPHNINEDSKKGTDNIPEKYHAGNAISNDKALIDTLA